jgi:hypothetical protein
MQACPVRCLKKRTVLWAGNASSSGSRRSIFLEKRRRTAPVPTIMANLAGLR